MWRSMEVTKTLTHSRPFGDVDGTMKGTKLGRRPQLRMFGMPKLARDLN